MKLIFLTLALGLISVHQSGFGSEAMPNIFGGDARLDAFTARQLVLVVTCTNAPVRNQTNFVVSVCITNNSTNTIGLPAPVETPDYHEARLLDANGRDHVRHFKPTGPSEGVSRLYQLSPTNNFLSYTMALPLTSPLEAGKYTLLVKRWCFVFLKFDSHGRVVREARYEFVSAPEVFDVY
jgi:hypothetical protein